MIKAENTIKELTKVFQKNEDKEIAVGAKAYMRNQFEFYGIKSPRRKEILKNIFISARTLDLNETQHIVNWCWKRDEREYQYFAMELLYRAKRKWDSSAINLAHKMIINKSWWDTVDYISSNIVGHFFDVFRARENSTIRTWAADGNMWIRRCSIIYQLKRKGNINLELLTFAIHEQEGIKEFFLQKAVGWALRQHAKTDPDWVVNFTQQNLLSPLALREALKNIR